MKKLKPPLVKGKTSYFPTKAKCPWCKNNKVLEPHSFTIFGGGAVLKDPDSGTWMPSDKMKGYFHIAWHGAHSKEGGLGKDPDTEAFLELARGVNGGQFDFFFCSTKCLREFLNSCVDELERQIEKCKQK